MTLQDTTAPDLRVGVVGCGKISSAYFTTLAAVRGVSITAVADLDPERARAAAQETSSRPATVEELLAADDVDLVLNLTIPAAHAEVALAAVAAGKHVYGEKPLAATSVQAEQVLEAARAAGVRVGCAPDTVLGTGIQTARQVVDAGGIGTPLAATAFFASPGPEGWHPDPAFLFAPGAGPLFDMGPYYLSSLVHLLGPVRRVIGASSRLREQRTIGSGPKAGTSFDVTVDTHATGVLEHDSGALSTLLMSFDVAHHSLPPIEVHGSAGSLSVPDPNRHAGEVRLRGTAAEEREVVAPSAGYLDTQRGCGVADLHHAVQAGQPHRASAELAAHVLEVMEAFAASAEAGRAVEIASSVERPALVPLTDLTA
ncbi:putative dehydrogenase [Motilibacter rhizosphaerae]|uniref:Putative dehydrogenase n=1 Tax=Motilibacter rhizosphaerae TaxID=598652 RepID=A0A4Q7NY93_9ACTN|nr:Gfo/Idh/MocA family oxidoreductase [Motilibacter rhizosphaerae]RZS91362.1 putative dehydrogenase [Motilibacter rhizosphaerae]